MTLTAKAAAGARLLTPTDHTLVLIDFQPQMAFATHSIDGVMGIIYAKSMFDAQEG